MGNAPAPRGRRQSLRSIKQVKQVPKLKGENCHAGGGARQQWPEARRTPPRTSAFVAWNASLYTACVANAPTGSPRSGRFKFLSNSAIQPLEKSLVLGREPAPRHPLRQSTSRSPHAGHVHARCESPFSAPARALCGSRQAPATPGLHSALSGSVLWPSWHPPWKVPGPQELLSRPPWPTTLQRCSQASPPMRPPHMQLCQAPQPSDRAATYPAQAP